MATINLTPDLEAALQARADAEGIPLEQLVNRLLQRETAELHPDWAPELARRIQALDEGKERPVSGPEALAGIRSGLSRGRRAAV